MDIRILNECWMGCFHNWEKKNKGEQKVPPMKLTFTSGKKYLTNQACTAQNKAVTNNQTRNFPLQSRSRQTSVHLQKTMQQQFRMQFQINLIQEYV